MAPDKVPGKVKFSLTLTDKMSDSLDDIAERVGISKSALIRVIIDEYLVSGQIYEPFAEKKEVEKK